MKLKLRDVDKRIIKAFFYSFIGSAASKALILLLGILLARLLGEEGYGKYSLVNSTIQTFVTVASMGIGASLVHYVAIHRNSDKKLCGHYIGSFSMIIVAMSAIVALAVCIFSDGVSIWAAEDTSLSPYFQIAAFVILFVAVCSALQSILLGFESFKTISVLEIVYGISIIVFAVSFAYFWNVAGALLGMLSARVLYSLLLLIFAGKVSKRERVRWRFNPDGVIWRAYKAFTLPSFLSSVFVIPVFWVLNTMLTRSAGYVDMAVHAISVQWVSIVNYLMSLFTRAKPIYTQLYADRNYKEFGKQVKRVVLIAGGVGIAIAVFAILLSKFILGLYGDGYVDQYMVFVLMMITAAINSVQSQFGTVLEVMGKMWIGLGLNIVWAINVVSFFLLFREYGALGYSIAYLIAYSIHCLLSFIIIWTAFNRAVKKEGDGK